jgi:hypothetical protein
MESTLPLVEAIQWYRCGLPLDLAQERLHQCVCCKFNIEVFEGMEEDLWAHMVQRKNL